MPGSMKFFEYWHTNGKAHENSPSWAKHRSNMVSAFPSYYSADHDSFSSELSHAIAQIDQLKHSRKGPAHLGEDPTQPDYRDVTEAVLPEVGQALDEVVAESVDLFDGMLNSNHPLTMINVLPPANKAGIIAATMANIFSVNIMNGEYSWNAAKAEMESAAMIARLVGWDPETAGGLYTYGGCGCYLYGIKYALARVLGSESRCKGIRVDGKVLVSQQAHYAKMSSTDWTGLGMDNVVNIETDNETNAMDLEDLEQKMKHCKRAGIPIVAIVCTTGTTDAFAIDPIDKVRELINKYPNPPPYNQTFLYADSVIGWSFLTFQNYNFKKNPLGFSAEVIPGLQASFEQISKVRYADAIGIDLHKTGWAPYNCSVFMMKDLNDFRKLMTRPGAAYILERTPYNPAFYSLEGSRSGSYAMAGWATLKYFGYRGFQSILGGILEVEVYLRKLLKEEKSMVCLNKLDHGFTTLFRVYPDSVTAETQYQNEVSKPSFRSELVKHNKLQARTADILWAWFRSGEEREGLYGPNTGFSSGFRTTDYNRDMSDGDAVLYALKSFPMNPNITAKTMDDLVKMVRMARDLALSGYVPPSSGPLVSRPYNVSTKSIMDAIPNDSSGAMLRKLSRSLSYDVVAARKRMMGMGVKR